MDWCYICHKYYESATSGACPYCDNRNIIEETTDHNTKAQ